jgi:hypothetical protein
MGSAPVGNHPMSTGSATNAADVLPAQADSPPTAEDRSPATEQQSPHADLPGMSD